MDFEKLDQLIKILNAREALSKWPTEFNDLSAKLKIESDRLGRELGVDTTKTQPAAAPMRELPQGNPNERRA